MPTQNLPLYACGSDLIVDYLEVCLRNEVEITAIINNLPDPCLAGLDRISLADYDFSAPQAPFLAPLFTPRNRYLATREALGRA